MKDGKMSGAELRQYLHISTRKLKYLLENGYIPCEISDHATHRYAVRIEDAEAFRYRQETEPYFLSELSGIFSSHNNTEYVRRPKPPILEPTAQNCRALKKFLTLRWQSGPSALTIPSAAALLGCTRSAMGKFIDGCKIERFKIGAVTYIAKEQLLAAITMPNFVAAAPNDGYKELLRAFKQRQCRERENEKRRKKRKGKAI